MQWIPTLLAVGGLGLMATSALAQDNNGNPNSTVSIGYSHGKIAGGDSVDGVTAKYNYELDQKPWGVMSTLTYMGGKQDGDTSHNGRKYHSDVDADYYSVGVGPSYRISPDLNAYGVVGVSKTDVQGTQRRAGSLATRQIDSDDTAVMYGAGVQYNPAPNWSVDLGYEGSRVSDGNDKRNLNAVNVGAGYRF